jgi:choline dehydrogenase-like flavoprotein
MTPAPTPLHSEVVVIGSGAAGSLAAKLLTEGGCDVLILEAGPARSFVPAETEVPRPTTVVERLGAARRGQTIQARAPAFTAQSAPFYVDDRDNPYVAPPDAPFLWFRGRQLGGRLHTWARVSLRMSPSELDRRDADRVPDEMRWPISYADLEPYYDRVEAELAVAGNLDGLPNVPDGRFRTPVPPAPSNMALAEKVARSTGQRLIRNRVAAMPAGPHPFGIADALRTGRLRIRTDAVVRHLLNHGTGDRVRAIGFHDRESGDYSEVTADVVVLAASAFESVRLLLNSASPRHPHGIGGGSGQLGRYVSDHVMVGRNGFAAGVYADLNHAAGFDPRAARQGQFDFGDYHSMYMPDFTGRWGPTPDFPGGYGIQCGVVPPVWWALAFGERRPRWEDQVTISDSVSDAWGIPAAHVAIRRGPDELRLIAHMTAAIEEIAAIAGVRIADPPLTAQSSQRDARLFARLKHTVVSPSGAFHLGAAIHESGGARMGPDPERSVVSPFCQCWEAPNLFVTDGACFVSPGFQNPTLTIMALTARACDYILRHYRRRITDRHDTIGIG